MTFQQVIDRLQTAGISPQMFSKEFRSLSPQAPLAEHEDFPWLGIVELAHRKATQEGEIGILTCTYHLPLHNVSFQITSRCLWAPKADQVEETAEWEKKYPGKQWVWEYPETYSPEEAVPALA